MKESFSIIYQLKSAFLIYKKHAISLSLIYSAVFLVLWAISQISLEFAQSGDLYTRYAAVLVNFFAQSFAGLGIVYLVLSVDLNRAPNLKNFFAKINRYPQFILSLFILFALFYAGLYFFIVPAILVLSFFIFAPYLVIDKNMSVAKAFKKSFLISKKHFTKIVLFLIILATLNYIAVWTILGLIISIPFTSVSVARLYHNLLCDYEKRFDASCDIYLVKHNLWEYVALSLVFIALFVQGARVFYMRFGSFKQFAPLQQQEKINMQNTPTPKASNSKLENVLQAVELYKDVFGAGSLPKNKEDLLKILSEQDLQGVKYRLINDRSFELCVDNVCKIYESRN